jgi:hypothetical protein
MRFFASENNLRIKEIIWVYIKESKSLPNQGEYFSRTKIKPYLLQKDEKFVEINLA